MTRKEILALLEMSESDQFDWLITTETIRFRRGKNGDIEWRESLAECAFRLRDEVVSIGGGEWFYTWSSLPFSGKDVPACQVAEPIHWIAAALLAKAGE